MKNSLSKLKRTSVEQIDLLRGGSIVSSLSGAFGGSLRETRVTALLGYLIALNPVPYMELFRFQGIARSIKLENKHDTGRSDILIETTEAKFVIEAKVDATDAFDQSQKYGACKVALLSSHRASSNQRQYSNVVYTHWDELAAVLRKQSHSSNPGIRFISNDLINYLKLHHMIRENDPVEIYAREINEQATLTLFLHAQMYGCWYQAGSRLPEARYFAPHFGQRIANTHPGIQSGISYIAKVETVEIVSDWNNFIDTTISVRGKMWYNKHKDVIGALHKHPAWDWKSDKKRSFIYMSAPRLVFSPPVKKDNIQDGKGFLSKNFLTFDDLYEAWGC